MLEKIFIKNDYEASVTFRSDKPEEILEYVRENKVDVAILDIELKATKNGLDLANEIRKWNKDMYIIFTSAHLEYILIAYKCKTFDFIPKPITYERIEETFIRLLDDMNNDIKSNNFLRIDNKNTIINQNNINFIKRDGMKLVFYTNTRTYQTYSSFKKIAKELPSNFIRCHKSYIANINNISNISENIINFDNNIKCYIGPKYKNSFMEVLKNDRDFTDNLE